MRFKLLSLAICSLVLAGCGGGNSSSESTVSVSYANTASGNADYSGTGTVQVAITVGTGSDPLTVTDIAVSGADAADFSTPKTTCDKTAAGSSCTVGVTYHAPAEGSTKLSSAATLNFDLNGVPTTVGGVFKPVALSAHVTYGTVTVAGLSGVSNITGQHATQTLTVAPNSGAQAVKIVKGGEMTDLGIPALCNLNYKGGSFPGTGGTCQSGVALTKSCSITLQMPVTNVGCLLTSPLTIAVNVVGGNGTQAVSVPVDISRVNVVVLGNQAGQVFWRPVGSGSWTSFKPTNEASGGAIDAVAVGGTSDNGKAVILAVGTTSGSQVLVDKMGTTGTFDASSWTDSDFPAGKTIEQLAIAKTASNVAFVFAMTKDNKVYYLDLNGSAAWQDISPSGNFSLQAIAAATGRSSQTVVMLLGEHSGVSKVFVQTVSNSAGDLPNNTWHDNSSGFSGASLNNLTVSGDDFQLTGSQSGKAKLFLQNAETDYAGSPSWISYDVRLPGAPEAAPAINSYQAFTGEAQPLLVSTYLAGNGATLYAGNHVAGSAIAFTKTTPAPILANKTLSIVQIYGAPSSAAATPVSLGTGYIYFLAANNADNSDGAIYRESLAQYLQNKWVAQTPTGMGVVKPQAMALTGSGLFP